MKRHLLSFLRSPIGYACNFIATLSGYFPIIDKVIPDHVMARLCETFCAHDDVQSDVLF
jgi:hypothetical protein